MTLAQRGNVIANGQPRQAAHHVKHQGPKMMNVITNTDYGNASGAQNTDTMLDAMSALSGVPTGERITRSAFNVDNSGVSQLPAGYSAESALNEIQEVSQLDPIRLLEIAGLKKRRRLQWAAAIAATTAALTAAGTLLSFIPLVVV